MISANSIRISKIVLVSLVLVNVFGFFILLGMLHSYNYVDASNLIEGVKNLKKYKPLMTSQKSELDMRGYIAEPGNVQIRFTNPKNRKGDPFKITQEISEEYRQLMSEEVLEPRDFDIGSIKAPKNTDEYHHANATILALVRNSEASALGRTLKHFERSFNAKFKYPYTFVNDRPFSQRFIDRMKKYSDAPMSFVQIPTELWDKPAHIDKKREREAMQRLADENVAYAQKGSYHNMCRFYSGTFYNIPELKKYKYFWRIEPGVDFYSDLEYDVFKYMSGTKKKYGFTIALYDIQQSVETLWVETLNFLNQGDNYKLINPNGSFQWLTENLQNPEKTKVANGYSTCHFWSNFEIGDMDFFRSTSYSKWFEYLDSTGKFYYERWGDAPIHSIGLGLFADRKDIHWFRDIGYYHDPYFNCPETPQTSRCEVGKFSLYKHLSDQNCLVNWLDLKGENPRAIY